MSEVQSGLEGVVAFATEIAEPDKEGGALRYRGVDIEDLVGTGPVREGLGPARRRQRSSPGLPPAEPHPLAVRSGDPRVDVQAALAMLAPEWGFRAAASTSRTSRRATTSRAPRSWRCPSSRSPRAAPGQPPVPQTEIDKADVDPRALPDPLARRGRPATTSRRSTPTGSPPPSTA